MLTDTPLKPNFSTSRHSKTVEKLHEQFHDTIHRLRDPTLDPDEYKRLMGTITNCFQRISSSEETKNNLNPSSPQTALPASTATIGTSTSVVPVAHSMVTHNPASVPVSTANPILAPSTSQMFDPNQTQAFPQTHMMLNQIPAPLSAQKLDTGQKHVSPQPQTIIDLILAPHTSQLIDPIQAHVSPQPQTIIDLILAPHTSQMVHPIQTHVAPQPQTIFDSMVAPSTAPMINPIQTNVSPQPQTIADNNKNIDVDGLEEKRDLTAYEKRSDRNNNDEWDPFFFYRNFINGLPKGQGYKDIHDLMVGKKKDTAMIAAVMDFLHTNERLEIKFKQTRSDDMFRIRIFGPSGDRKDIIDIKNVFTDWMNLTPEKIIKSCECLAMYSGDFTWNKDLVWSTQTILNSIENKFIASMVQKRLDGYDPIHRVGPLALYFTLHEIIMFDNAKTIDDLYAGLAKLSLADFNNESTKEHASVWLEVVAFLEKFNKAPVYATTLLLEQYGKCSVAAFRSHFSVLANVADSRLNSIESILREGQITERRLKIEGKWNPTKKQGLTFFGTTKKTHKQPKVKPTNESKTLNKKSRATHDRNGNLIEDHLPPPPKSGASRQIQNFITSKNQLWCGKPTCQDWEDYSTTSTFEDFDYQKKSHARKKRNGKKDKHMTQSYSSSEDEVRSKYVDAIGFC